MLRSVGSNCRTQSKILDFTCQQNLTRQVSEFNQYLRSVGIRTLSTLVNSDCNSRTEHDSQKETSNVLPRKLLQNGPGLEYFLQKSQVNPEATVNIDPVTIPYVSKNLYTNLQQKVYFDVYGCQMNVNDSDIVWSILQSHGYLKTEELTDADIILLVTCAIREGAESKIWHRLKALRNLKLARRNTNSKSPMKIGVIGCMAERLKEKLVEREKSVDVVAGPDSYRDLPRLLALTQDNQTAVNVMLSFDETYADIMPVRLNQDSVSAFVSIMRGCDNMCSYCIVPFTRGRERSRPIASILEEIKILSQQGVKEVTLLGQNVNSYRDTSESSHTVQIETKLAKGFRTVYKNKHGGIRFAELLDKVSMIDPNMRIRFTSPHPKDFPDEVLHLVKERNNICKHIHLPAQSGNSSVLQRMRRGYTRESYLDLVQHVRQLIPDISLSSDFICGFCGETEEEFADTLSLLKEVQYNVTYIFAYSLREKTHAHRRMQDDVPQEVKLKRLQELMNLYRLQAEHLNKTKIGSIQLVLVEGESRRSPLDLAGRTDGNIRVIIPSSSIPESNLSTNLREVKPGDYIAVQINEATSQVFKGIPLYHTSLAAYRSHPTYTI